MTELVGIINLTPDSFSGDGIKTNAAVKQALGFVKEGATIIDIGAESTKPNAKTITHEQEWKRLKPFLNRMGEYKKNLKISVDTRHYETAKKSIDIGADWINDVSGFSDKKMIEAVRDSDVSLVVMHNLGIPADPKITIKNCDDTLATVMNWAENKINELEGEGINKNRIIFDPGIGFGKTAKQSMQLIENISFFKSLGVKILVGHSRKSFLTIFTDKPAQQRDDETARISAILAENGVDYIRVHNITANKEELCKVI